MAGVVSRLRIESGKIKIHRTDTVAVFCWGGCRWNARGGKDHAHRESGAARRGTVEKHEGVRCGADNRAAVYGSRRGNIGDNCFAGFAARQIAGGNFHFELAFVFDGCPNQFRIWTIIPQHSKIGLTGFTDSKSIPQSIGRGDAFCLGCPSDHGSHGGRGNVGMSQLDFHCGYSCNGKRNGQAKQAWTALSSHSTSVQSRTIPF